jgi:hypothetical protein
MSNKVLKRGCSLAVGQDVRTYDTCLSRHPDDTTVCEGPRQADELEPSVVQPRSAEVSRQSPRGGLRLLREGSPSSVLLHLPRLIQAECRAVLGPEERQRRAWP